MWKKISKMLRNANAGWSTSTASNLKGTTDVWSYAVRANASCN